MSGSRRARGVGRIVTCAWGHGEANPCGKRMWENIWDAISTLKYTWCTEHYLMLP